MSVKLPSHWKINLTICFFSDSYITLLSWRLIDFLRATCSVFCWRIFRHRGFWMFLQHRSPVVGPLFIICVPTILSFSHFTVFWHLRLLLFIRTTYSVFEKNRWIVNRCRLQCSLNNCTLLSHWQISRHRAVIGSVYVKIIRLIPVEIQSWQNPCNTLLRFKLKVV